LDSTSGGFCLRRPTAKYDFETLSAVPSSSTLEEASVLFPTGVNALKLLDL
jgi:hypothetical protein